MNVIFLMDVVRFLYRDTNTAEYSIAEQLPAKLPDTEKTGVSRQHAYSFLCVTCKQRLCLLFFLVECSYCDVFPDSQFSDVFVFTSEIHLLEEELHSKKKNRAQNSR